MRRPPTRMAEGARRPRYRRAIVCRQSDTAPRHFAACRAFDHMAAWNSQARRVGAGRETTCCALSADDRDALAASAQDLALASGEVLHEPDYPLDLGLLPPKHRGAVGRHRHRDDGRTVESDTVGYESVVGVLNALGGCAAVNRTFAQIPVRGADRRIAPAPPGRPEPQAPPASHAPASDLAQAHQSVACIRPARPDPAPLPLAADVAGPHRLRRGASHAGLFGDDARRAADHRHRGARRAGRAWAHPPGARPYRYPRPRRMLAAACECYETVRANLEQLVAGD